MRSYAIGDIHGQIDLLRGAHARIERDRAETGDAEAPVVHVGDLVDRGPDSAGVIAFLSEGIAAGAPWVVLKGNHDRMFAGFLERADFQDPMLRPDYTWLHPRVGGLETLASYGIANPGRRPVAELHAEARDKVPAAHHAFLAGLPTHLHRGEVFFVHAGIRPGLPLTAQTEDDMTWIRRAFLDDLRDHGALIVHGHTPVERATHYGNRLNIDSGAAYGGPLSVVVIEDRDVWELTERGRQPLPPY
ncbi:serine/threonine protein phosphatase [Defluviimonas sp. 20V17]|uniref:Serine/threonine protein phosphatase n=1 Tax=Allgaiera indica TaxID=765699 RepID=A0AAN4UNS0_9RHOB|nr:metallophosphoesterase [Allgaiera indica]KDB01819.1 serine/threonine protein phosphatase [Defluviimonas sp. 20V17]GHD98928.1 serine/threonine protein phosphatase [Allgaiera indica]SDW03296.1 serine/threonine protein phosphatase 1 [Allgaiera indica]